ncbi:MAG: hypothetical protein LBL26_03850 [Peptococcaceae bacterium]|nr:hypothetical protein [Peptococcaceae bacterium]
MKAAVFIRHKSKSVSAANDISRYFYRRHPEYYAKIVNYDDYQKFDALDENYYMDLYVLELNCCEESDCGFRIAKRLRIISP